MAFQPDKTFVVAEDLGAVKGTPFRRLIVKRGDDSVFTAIAFDKINIGEKIGLFRYSFLKSPDLSDKTEFYLAKKKHQ